MKSLLQKAAFSISISIYPLKNSAILDSASTLHVFNEITRFLNFRTAYPGDFLWAGDHKVPIQGYGDVDVEIQSPTGKRLMRLHDVAFCKNFAANLVSLRELHKLGYWWDNRPGFNHIRKANRNYTTVATLTELHGQNVLEYIPDDLTKASFFNRRNYFNSWTERKPVTADAWTWHLRLGHAGPQSLQHLVTCSEGARIRRKLEGPITIDCDGCAAAKISRKVRREPRSNEEDPGERLAVDFHDFKLGFGGFKSLVTITDRWSGFIWDFYLSSRTAETIMKVLTYFFDFLKRQYKIEPKVMEMDGELYTQKPEVKRFLEQQSMRVEPSPPYTQALNGSGERSGGVIKQKIIAMGSSSNLPKELWPEITRAAVYLYNRTPRYSLNWKSPYELFHTRLAHRDGVVIEERKPQQAHLKVYGCKAYYMTTDALKKTNRLDRLKSRAWIGFLVGYDSTNVYRIWNPVFNRVIRTRDVIFDEKTVFDGDIEAARLELKKAQIAQNMSLDQLAELLQRLDETEAPEPDRLNLDDDNTVMPGPDNTDPDDHDLDSHDSDENQLWNEESLKDYALDTLHLLESYPTPPETPSALLTDATYRIPNKHDEDPHDDTNFEPWKAAFTAGRLVQPEKIQRSRRRIGKGSITRENVELAMNTRQGLESFHRKQLPPEPKTHRDLEAHPLGDLFIQAEIDHLRSHAHMDSWTEIEKKDPTAKGQQVLGCMWVYVYKFTKKGMLAKCKARLVVRGDQQVKSVSAGTYAATLAARSFRVFMAMAARFDLELTQYDAVNAFVHANLDETVFMKMPDGYRKTGHILKLNKALYGLRRSPILWQQMLKKALQGQKFREIPHEPCCMARNGILVFFYVDDIVFAHRGKDQSLVKQIVKGLRKEFELSGGDPLHWFLGIEIIRDREKKLIWLSQSSYIDKIANLAGSKQPDATPMSRDELLPYNDVASSSQINLYQRKVGSLMYAAVVTRPDIAFAVSRLARFLTNPGPLHQAAADRTLLYLKRHRDLGLQLGGGDKYLVASDASFADNTADRKSSQGYAMKLFGGLVGWRANKQATVTTSTTEAELMALSQAAREGIYIRRMLEELEVNLDQGDDDVVIQCDNQQTLRLVQAEIGKLSTKLKHVDIQNHWLRQEYQRRHINVCYVDTKSMIADGLTKALPLDSHRRFLDQMNLIDIRDRLLDRLQDRRTQEAAPTFEPPEPMDID